MGQDQFQGVRRKGTPLDERSDPRTYRAQSAPSSGIAPATVQYYPPWIKRPDTYQDFYFRTNIGTSVGAGATISPAEVQFNIAAAQRGVIDSVTLFVNAPDVTLDVNWILLFNSIAVPGWTRGSFARVATNLSISYNEQAIRIREGTSVAWSIVNNTAVSWTVGVEMTGWFYPSSEETRILGRLT